MTAHEPSSQAGLASIRGGMFSAGPGSVPVRMAPPLLPCPMCGGRLRLTAIPRSLDGDPTWLERCTKCGHELEL